MTEDRTRGARDRSSRTRSMSRPTLDDVWHADLMHRLLLVLAGGLLAVSCSSPDDAATTEPTITARTEPTTTLTATTTSVAVATDPTVAAASTTAAKPVMSRETEVALRQCVDASSPLIGSFAVDLGDTEVLDQAGEACDEAVVQLETDGGFEDLILVIAKWNVDMSFFALDVVTGSATQLEADEVNELARTFADDVEAYLD